MSTERKATTPVEGSCKSCTGMLIYSDFMKMHNQDPACIGVIGKPSEKKIKTLPLESTSSSVSDTNDMSSTNTPNNSNDSGTSLTTSLFIIFGYSQFYSPKNQMSKGSLVIKKYHGLRIYLTKEEQAVNPKHKKTLNLNDMKALDKNANEKTLNDDDGDDDDESSITPLQYAVNINTQLYTIMKKGMIIQCRNMVNLQKQAVKFSEGLPAKLSKNANSIYQSSKKTANRIYRGMTTLWNNSPGSSK